MVICKFVRHRALDVLCGDGIRVFKVLNDIQIWPIFVDFVLFYPALQQIRFLGVPEVKK